jgi:hypothetical protein
MHLIGPLPHPTNNDTYKKEYELAEQMTTMDHPLGHRKFLYGGNWWTRLEDIPDPPAPQHVFDFIEYLLIIYHERRPIASEALAHRYFQHKEGARLDLQVLHRQIVRGG